ncbi:dodecin family protein [Haliea sp. E1-2-M8]|uniref:dodecin n=1 Tax=Haliea sp. E1-2-M8 TaxID=3064706 RepID=UPI00271D3217|nr:dodecin [Haliea sp. E1-2-M8]MDO8862087.1 dodecin family protein [Haliea sp. E1-2-M8]
MSHIYKVIDIVGSSPSSIEDAIDQAIARTSDTVKNVEWFQVDQVRGHVENGKVGHYQVAIKLGFRLDEK